jgi:hypothetical protein
MDEPVRPMSEYGAQSDIAKRPKRTDALLCVPKLGFRRLAWCESLKQET